MMEICYIGDKEYVSQHKHLAGEAWLASREKLRT